MFFMDNKCKLAINLSTIFEKIIKESTSTETDISGLPHLNRVRTSSEIQKSRVFQGCFTVFSRAFPGFLEVQNENNVHL